MIAPADLQGGLRESCGIFGVFNDRDATELTALGLHALQHRGQEICGLASWDGNHFNVQHHSGHVADYFTRRGIIDSLRGSSAIGHVRYATKGGSSVKNAQPVYADFSDGGCALAHNGQLVNFQTLRQQLSREGAIFHSSSDSEIILHLIARARDGCFADRLCEALKLIRGGFALTGITAKKLFGVRDPHGLRPLLLGRLGDAWLLASESCAFDLVNAKLVRSLEPGEVVIISAEGIESRFPMTPQPSRPCAFELIYFARPDSVVDGRSVYNIRKSFGAALAHEAPADADLVVPVPDSGVPAALGYAAAAGLPFEFGLIRNHYIGRTFIEPSQKIRTLGVRLKHNVNAELVRGKRVVLVDDSIVRGTTSIKLVQMVYEAGAAEVHFRVAAPPIRYPDYYGIDLPDTSLLFAADRDLKAMTQRLGTDSLGFLSLDGLYRAAGYQNRNKDAPQLADHCFSGDYPIPPIVDDDDAIITRLAMDNDPRAKHHFSSLDRRAATG